jgi:hypothetical protein
MISPAETTTTSPLSLSSKMPIRKANSNRFTTFRQLTMFKPSRIILNSKVETTETPKEQPKPNRRFSVHQNSAQGASILDFLKTLEDNEDNESNSSSEKSFEDIEKSYSVLITNRHRTTSEDSISDGQPSRRNSVRIRAPLNVYSIIEKFHSERRKKLAESQSLSSKIRSLKFEHDEEAGIEFRLSDDFSDIYLFKSPKMFQL